MHYAPEIIHGDARALPLPDESVDLVVTSPPYFNLRNYAADGQIGNELTPREYIAALIECTREMVRVLKPSGSIFVNLGDKYAQTAAQWGGSRRGHQGVLAGGRADNATQFGTAAAAGAPKMGAPKSLMLLPQRYAIRCIDELGLILRAEIVWAKPNGLPESVTDRVRRSHEQVFHFVRSPRYYSAVDEVREPSDPANAAHAARYNERAKTYGKTNNDRVDKGAGLFLHNPLGKLPGSVWEIPTAPLVVPDHLGVDHFAAYPPELVRRIVTGWSPRQVCTACGEGRRPVAERLESTGRARATTAARDPSWQAINRADWAEGVRREITGYACACPDTDAPTTPGVVLDPFGGTGTTALVASVLGRVGISIDLSADYVRLARWRTTDPGERARALGVPKPPPQVEGQLGLFEGGAA